MGPGDSKLLCGPTTIIEENYQNQEEAKSTNTMQMGQEGFHLEIPLTLTDKILYLF